MAALDQRSSWWARVVHLVVVVAVVASTVAVVSVATAGVASAAPCTPPVVNEVACENTRPGTPDWQVGYADETIAGFTTDISTVAGGQVDFKIVTDAASYRVDLFRLGWYGGAGARQVGLLNRTTPQSQPACLRDATGLADCGNWAVSLSWTVPVDAVSGIYYARLHRHDTGAENEIAFVVRDDASTSDILFQTSDSTWQAYNRFGGASMYVGDGPGKDGSAFKVSYNRPLFEAGSENFIFNAEYPMLKFLERNGYDLSYTTNVDTARRGELIRNHDVFMAVGHDEYWSNEQRASVEAARDAGVHLAFLTGNEIFWKTRWEPSVDGTATDWRTVVSYKETKDPQTDPSSQWTGTWRDPRFSPPKDGGRPENALLGNIFTVNGRRDDAMQVPAEYGRMRLWRHTDLAAMAPGGVYSFQPGTLGYEWNTVEDNGFQPAGVAQLSRTTVDLQGPFALQNYGDFYDSEVKTHALTLYRASSGALVFGAGTVQWAWGVEDDHAFLTNTPTSDPRMQQATVNLLADMGVQPSSLQTGLTAAAASTDTTAPTVTVDPGPTPVVGEPYTVSGTVSDTGGFVAGVEVSTDGGTSWRSARWTAGATAWTYEYVPAASGPTTLMARAVDDSVNLSTPVAVSTATGTAQCPCSIWPAATVPEVVDTPDNGPIELGVKWRSSSAGYVRGVRFYKGPGNTGTHTGSLWSASGEQLAHGVFVDETPTGWQTLLFPVPVAVAADTTYVVSYHTPTGRYSSDVDYFTVRDAAQEPLTALRAGVDGSNGVFLPGGPGFPSRSFRNTNYWVDVVWAPDPGPDTRAPALTATGPIAGAGTVALDVAPSATFDEAIDPASVQFTVTAPGGPAAGTASVSPDGTTVTFAPSTALAPATTYTATLNATDVAGNAVPTSVTWSFTTGSPRPATCPCTVWDDFTRPAIAEALDNAPIEVGTRVRFDGRGEVLGVRFYKGGSRNSGTHTGSLWTATGQRLATGTFTGESASGWQTLTFATPVAVQGNTTYVVSYLAPSGNYAVSPGYFTERSADAGPMHALQSGVDGGNGVYRYGAGGGFPTGTYNGGNYWVDAIYRSGLNGDTTPPTLTGRTPGPGATGVPVTSEVTVTFSEPVDVTSAQFTLTDPGGARIVGTAAGSDGRTVTWTPAAPLAPDTTYAMSARIADDNGVAMPVAETWSFTTGAAACPCSLFSAATVPTVAAVNDPGAIELGVRFSATVSGKVTGVRFYKGPGNTGTHTGSLWSAGGQQLASGTFTDESATGWQTLTFASPVTLTAGTTYVASYSTTTGFYSADSGYFGRTAVAGPVLRAPAAGEGSPNGVYRVGGGFPSSTYQGGNYWVDVVFMPSADTVAPSVTSSAPGPGATGVPVDGPVTATFDEPIQPAEARFGLTDPRGASLGGALTVSADGRTVSWTPDAPLVAGTAYTAAVRAVDLDGNAMPVATTWTFTTGTAACPCSLFSTATVPTVPNSGDDGDYELGVRVVPAVDGQITAVRFFKGPQNTGPHTGSVWTASGERLATGTFTGETATGWQTLVLDQPVPVVAGTTYVASYTTQGYYSLDPGYFSDAATVSPPLTAPRSGTEGGNGVYAVGTGFPGQTYQGGNYWVDVVVEVP